MELSTRFDYEALHTIEIVDPVTDQPVGVTMQIRSWKSKEARKVQRETQDGTYKTLRKGKSLTTEHQERGLLRQAAACIASWDWHGALWHGEKPELSTKAAIDVMELHDFIFDAVVEAAQTYENFSPSSARASAKT